MTGLLLHKRSDIQYASGRYSNGAGKCPAKHFLRGVLHLLEPTLKRCRRIFAKTSGQFLREGEKWVICKIGLPGIELDNPEIMASQVSGQDVEERGFSYTSRAVNG